MILHNYALSPYSEKIRLMFGYAGVAWRSALCPEMPPRAGVDPLVGGYRRIPVAQDGADLFCDSRLISAEIAALADKPALDPANCDESALGLSAGLEAEVFMACIAAIPPGRTLKQLFRKMGLSGAVRFIIDRAGIAKQAQSPTLSHKRAVILFDRHLRELEQCLAKAGPFLFGDTPSHADFAAYHTFWFHRVVGELPMPQGVPAVAAWYARMGEFGHGQVSEIAAGTAFDAARQAEPRAIPQSLLGHERLGDRVTVQPVDYALDGTSGELAGGDESRWIIARDTEFGRLHVHFPCEGFNLV